MLIIRYCSQIFLYNIIQYIYIWYFKCLEHLLEDSSIYNLWAQKTTNIKRLDLYGVIPSIKYEVTIDHQFSPTLSWLIFLSSFLETEPRWEMLQHTAVPDMLILNYSIRIQVIAVDLFEATIVWSSMASIGRHNH